MNVWQTARFRIDLAQPRVMGIVNVTPDSFSDGGSYADAAAALRHCEEMIGQGADILDIGGESTRPGSPAVPLELELARVLPVVREAVRLGVAISVDTYKPEVMRAVLDLGADIINDIWALRQPGAREAIAAHPACGVCLMHMHRDPQTMQASPMEGDVVPQVRAFLVDATEELKTLGIDDSRIVLDPGIGFGKTVPQNFSLLARQQELLAAGYPLLAGWSRKSSLGAVTGIADASARLLPSVVAAVLAVERGARIVRVHDVRETVEALAVWRAMNQEPPGPGPARPAPRGGSSRDGRATSTQEQPRKEET
ncbi:dihydropteroate synthase [Variovorax rhizosphaerae]|uniref:Dihydropteroate synthase n=1 Tax=Variovorax rhizosphaerae TaxID=1836200 RepID=A0ABU8WJA7_9BURK